jgi:hypothetical protein
MRIGKKNNALLKTLAYYKHSLKSPTKWKTWQEIWNLECQEYLDSFKKNVFYLVVKSQRALICLIGITWYVVYRVVLACIGSEYH